MFERFHVADLVAVEKTSTEVQFHWKEGERREDPRLVSHEGGEGGRIQQWSYWAGTKSDWAAVGELEKRPVSFFFSFPFLLLLLLEKGRIPNVEVNYDPKGTVRRR